MELQSDFLGRILSPCPLNVGSNSQSFLIAELSEKEHQDRRGPDTIERLAATVGGSLIFRTLSCGHGGERT